MSLLEMTGIALEFPGVKALSDVNFSVESGSIHALVGANGAGKSTLMKILGGVHQDYVGRICIDGKELRFRSPREARRLGIDVVYQEVDTALVPHFSVAENIMLESVATEPSWGFFVRHSRIRAEARKRLEILGLDMNPRARVSDCTLAEKQMILIARALSPDCRFLVLDEPTAPLGPQETQALFSVLRGLVGKGIGIVFISHRLPEVLSVCDVVTILRDGKFVDCLPTRRLQIPRLVELMLGVRLDEEYPKKKVPIGDPVLEVKGLRDRSKLKGIDLSVRAGEIVGLAGLVGAGKSELCKALFGAEPVSYESASWKGRPFRIQSPRKAVAIGFGLVPEERRKEGVLVNESIAFNLAALGRGVPGRLGFIDVRGERSRIRRVIEGLGIRTTDERKKVAELSGGNQQKVAVGKWLLNDAELYLFDEPTKGVDVRAKHDIFELIGSLAAAGKAIVYASSELSEILGISDRIYVLYDGRVAREVQGSETNEEELLFLSAGGSK